MSFLSSDGNLGEEAQKEELRSFLKEPCFIFFTEKVPQHGGGSIRFIKGIDVREILTAAEELAPEWDPVPFLRELSEELHRSGRGRGRSFPLRNFQFSQDIEETLPQYKDE